MGMYATVMGTELKYSGLFAEDASFIGAKEMDAALHLSKLEVKAILQRGYCRFKGGFGENLDNYNFSHIAIYAKKLATLSEWVEFSKESELIFT